MDGTENGSLLVTIEVESLAENCPRSGISKEWLTELNVGESRLNPQSVEVKEKLGDCSFWRPKAVVSKAKLGSGELNVGNCGSTFRAAQPYPSGSDPRSDLH